MNEKELLQKLKALPKEIEPEHELWPGVEKSIRPRRSEARQWMLAVAGLMVMLTGVLFWQARPDPSSVSTEDLRLMAREWQNEQLRYASTLKGLSSQISELEQNQQLYLASHYQRGLNGVLAAERSLTKAMVASPGDEFLSRKLADVQAVHLDLLRDIIERSRARV